ncbi:MAG: SseB family protein [Gemmatimonadetes bacterium]|nr:SseB family protein [Gemmatimonadota bacterium]
MPDQPPDRLPNILRRTAADPLASWDLADVLRDTEELWVIPDPEDFIRYNKELTAVFEEKGITRSDAAAPPRLNGETTSDGFMPRVFSNDDRARDWAVSARLIAPDSTIALMTRSPQRFLYDSLSEGYAGWIFDDGSLHKVTLMRRSLAQVYGLTILPDIAKMPTLHILMRLDKVFVQRGEGDERGACIFTSQQAADLGVQLTGRQLDGMASKELPTARLLQSILRAGVTRLVVNPTFPAECSYTRPEMMRLTELAMAAPAPVEDGEAQDAPKSETSKTTSPPIDPDVDTVAWATRFPTRAAVPPPGRSDEDSRQVFKGMWERVNADAIPMFEYLRILGFDLDLYVGVLDKPVQGVIWPQPMEYTDRPGRLFVHTYSVESKIQEKLAGRPPEEQRYVHLSTVEFLRWVWAAPKIMEDIFVDAFEGNDGQLQFPLEYALSVIYPHFVEITDVRAVPNVGLARMGLLPGARGLQAEVVKTLLQGWVQLFGTTGVDPIELDGRTYLAAFTSSDRFFAYESTQRDFRGAPVPAGEEPAFGAWLEATDGIDGIVLDPGSEARLPLDHTDLLGLDLWSRSGHQPRGSDFAAAVARRLTAGIMSPRTAARILADWPQYYLGLQTIEAGANVLKMPGGDILPIFTTKEKVEAFIQYYLGEGVLEGSWEPVLVSHKWMHSAFLQASRTYEEGAWVDPEPDPEHGGVRVHPEMLAHAIERIDEQLKPRVPGFVWED